MARSGILKQVSFPDSLSNQFQQNVGDAFDKVCADADVLNFPATALVASGPISPGKTVVVYKGSPGATLMLPAASAQGSSVAAVILVGNESTGAITLQPTGGNTINGAASLAVGSGALVAIVSDGVTRWLAISASPTGLPVVIQSGAFSGVSSLASTAWAIGAFARVEIELRLATGTVGTQHMSFGFSAGSNYTVAAYNSTGGTWTQGNSLAANDFAWSVGTLPGQLSANAQIGTDGAFRTFTARVVDGAATQGAMDGVSTDVSTNVTGVTFTFAGTSSGRLEIRGFA